MPCATVEGAYAENLLRWMYFWRCLGDSFTNYALRVRTTGRSAEGEVLFLHRLDLSKLICPNLADVKHMLLYKL